MIPEGRRVVLLTAFACDPRLPSEPTIGWEYLTAWLAIAESRDLHVVASMNERSRAATTERLRELELTTDRLTIVCPAERPPLTLLRHHRLTRVEHLVWSLRTPRAVRRAVDPHRVLLARHVTFASELLPPPITWLHGLALTVWGPVGSTGRADAYLFPPRQPRWRRHFVVQRLRDRVSRASTRRIARRVSLTLTTSEPLAEVVRSSGGNAEVFPNTRPITPAGELGRRRPTEPDALRLLCVGNLIPLKRFELAIAALAHPSLSGATLRIAGKPAPGAANTLRDLAAELGVADRVAFLGQVPREAVVGEMTQADVLVHLSAREGGSGVVGEATAVGLPVVVFAGTGSAAVLEFSGSVGVAIGRDAPRTIGTVASAITSAAVARSAPSTVWTGSRLVDKERELVDLALASLEAS